jgi:hypothetical protein
MRFLARPFRGEDQINAAFRMFLLPGGGALRKQRKDVMFTHETPGVLLVMKARETATVRRRPYRIAMIGIVRVTITTFKMTWPLCAGV